MKNYILLFFLLLLSFKNLAQNQLSQVDENFDKANHHYAQKEYEKTLLYLQLSKLSNITSKEDITLLEIQSLYSSKDHSKCLSLIDLSFSTINMSLKSLNVISTIKLKIQEFKEKKRIKVEKLKSIRLKHLE